MDESRAEVRLSVARLLQNIAVRRIINQCPFAVLGKSAKYRLRRLLCAQLEAADYGDRVGGGHHPIGVVAAGADLLQSRTCSSVKQ